MFIQSSWANTSLRIDGLDGTLSDNVNAYLSAIPKEDYSTSLRFQALVRDNIIVALKALGYYEPKIQFFVPEGENKLIVEVAKGEPVLIKEVDIVLQGGANEDIEFKQLIEKSGITKGSVLDHSKYDSLKSSFRNLALTKGYFDGSFTKTALEVAPELKQAFIRLHYSSGVRYRYGATDIIGSQIDEARVRSLIPYKEGEPYQTSDVGLLNQRLSNTEWFSSVAVKPDIENIGNSQLLPMVVTLSPQSKNRLETGIGYASDIGIRGSLKWNKPWVNSYGHSFDSSLSVSEPEQTILLSYKVPLEDVLHEYYQFRSGMRHESNLDTESFEVNAMLERHWELDSGWHRTLFVKYLEENFTQGAQDDVIRMLIPGISFSRTRMSSGTMPMSGSKHSITFEVADDSVISLARMFRVQGRSAWIGSIGNNHRSVARIGLSANIVDNILDLPPSLRFFAGGDNNLRGYEFESISPKDATGSLIGAKYMATTSLEYQYRIKGNWWLATFIDAGDAWNDTAEPKIGSGFGVRWASPVGPVRLDFAWGLDNDNDFQFHFALGPEL